MRGSEDKPDEARREPEVLPRPFGAYTLLGHLGTGGMGDVYLAARAGFAGIAKLCVVKTLRPGFGEDREYVTRFLDEARVVVQLNHKNICPVFEVGKVGARHFLAMEYIPGRDLKTIGQRAAAAGKSFEPGLALFIVSEVLEALDYAHRLADPLGTPLLLVHRDVSPHNVMVGFEGDVRLIDFGLAASTMKTEMTAPNVVMGKVAYMSQEQICGEKLDARADQFSAAVMAYELFTGERFYEGRSAKETYHLAALGGFRPQRFASLPDPLRAVLDRALAVDRQERFATCGEMREGIESYRFEGGMRGDGPALRTLMHAVFASEIAQERLLVTRAGDVSAAEPAADVTVSARSASAPATEARPDAPWSVDTKATSSVPAAKARPLVADGTEAVRRASGTVADLERPPPPRRWPLLAAAAAVAVVAVVVVAGTLAVTGGQAARPAVDAGVAVALVTDAGNPGEPAAARGPAVLAAGAVDESAHAGGSEAPAAADAGVAAAGRAPVDAGAAGHEGSRAEHPRLARAHPRGEHPPREEAAKAHGADARAKPPPPRGNVHEAFAYLEARCPKAACLVQLEPYKSNWAVALSTDARNRFRAKLEACVDACAR